MSTYNPIFLTFISNSAFDDLHKLDWQNLIEKQNMWLENQPNSHTTLIYYPYTVALQGLADWSAL